MDSDQKPHEWWKKTFALDYREDCRLNYYDQVRARKKFHICDRKPMDSFYIYTSSTRASLIGDTKRRKHNTEP